MTNELIEAIPSPLWLITKPGGYKHINQFGRVYRTRELALRHCDVNEMVVELRLAPAPEPGAVSPDQSLRGMAVYADEVPPIPASAPSAAEQLYRLRPLCTCYLEWDSNVIYVDPKCLMHGDGPSEKINASMCTCGRWDLHEVADGVLYDIDGSDHYGDRPCSTRQPVKSGA